MGAGHRHLGEQGPHQDGENGRAGLRHGLTELFPIARLVDSGRAGPREGILPFCSGGLGQSGTQRGYFALLFSPTNEESQTGARSSYFETPSHATQLYSGTAGRPALSARRSAPPRKRWHSRQVLRVRWKEAGLGLTNHVE